MNLIYTFNINIILFIIKYVKMYMCNYIFFTLIEEIKNVSPSYNFLFINWQKN